MRRSQKTYRFTPLDHVPAECLVESLDDPLRLQPFYFSGGGSAPDPPDYAAAAEAQGVADKETAMVNAGYARPTQYTPNGSQTWAFQGADINNPKPGDWVVNSQLDPASQYINDQNKWLSTGLNNTAISQLGRVSNIMGQDFDMSKITSRPDQNTMNYTSAMANYLKDVGGAGTYGQGLNRIDPNSAGINRIYSEAGYIPNSVDAFNQLGKQAQDASYNKATQYMGERFARSDAAMDTQLRNQGLQPGTEAYKTAMVEAKRSQNEAYSGAQNDAIATGNQVANQNYQNLINATTTRQGLNTQASSANLANAQGVLGSNTSLASALQGMDTNAQQSLVQAIQARMGLAQNQQQLGQSQMQMEAYLRSLPLNEANALRTGNQVSMPQFTQYQQGTAQSAPIYQSVNDQYGQQMAGYNADQASASNFNSGLMQTAGTVGMAAMMMSDRSLKTNINRLGTTPGGTPWYSFEYAGVPGFTYEGVMADEAPPEAVHMTRLGLAAVDYARIV